MKRLVFIVLFALVLIVPLSAGAMVDVNAARKIPVQEGGRVKPLDAYARELVRNITGRGAVKGDEPLTTLFRWMSEPHLVGKAELILIDYLPLRKALGFDPAKRRQSLDSISENAKFDDFIAQLRNKPDGEQTKLDKEGGALFHRAMLFAGAMNMDLPLVPGALPGEPWDAPLQIHGVADTAKTRLSDLWMQMVRAFENGDQTGFNRAASDFAATTKRLAGAAMVSDAHLNVEVWYAGTHPARWAWIFYLAAFLLFIAFAVAEKPKLRWIGVVVWSAGFAMHLAALLLRAYISGRAPWSNMYESMQMLAFGIVFFAALFELFSKLRIFLPASAVLGMIALIINDASPFDPAISPLAPVLKSYWLTFHVMIMMLGYSACALAMGLGHFVLGYELFGARDSDKLQALDKGLYRVLQVAILFLIAGIILGAMWANESWGRYWGWDPKETWSLITWFYYLAVAHGRYSGWWKRTGTAVLAIAGFPVVLMTYYGVNYFLVGLHSYAGGGSPEPMPLFVWIYLVFELVFLVGFWWRRKVRPAAEQARK